MSSSSAEPDPKRLQLLHEAVPTATTVAALLNPSFPSAENQSRDLQAAARTLGLQLHVMHASTERDFDMVFANLAQLRASGLATPHPADAVQAVAQPDLCWRLRLRPRA